MGGGWWVVVGWVVVQVVRSGVTFSSGQPSFALNDTLHDYTRIEGVGCERCVGALSLSGTDGSSERCAVPLG